MLILWGIKLGVTSIHKEPIPAFLAPNLFFPFLILFALFYPVSSFFMAKKDDLARQAKFDLISPLISTFAFFELARYVIFAIERGSLPLALAGILFTLIFIEMARRLAPGGQGINTFVTSSLLTLTLALPVILGSTTTGLPLLSLAAYGTFFLATRWGRGGIRFIGYLFQVYCTIYLTWISLISPPGGNIGHLLSSALVALISLAHYKYCRTYKPPDTGVFFTKIDQRDLSAVFLFLGSLMSAFIMFRIIAYRVLAAIVTPSSLPHAFSGAQSTIINASAAVLMLFALAHGKKEVRNVALFVTLVGAVKVFLYDLIGGGIRGLPLVVSVFSFGLTTALESYGLTRWHRFAAEEEKTLT